MTLRFTEGFDSYQSTSDLLKKWQSNGGAVWNSTAGRNGGGAIQMSSAVSLTSYPIPLGGGTQANMGFWFMDTLKPAATTITVNMLSVGFASVGQIAVTTNGFMQLRNSGGANIVIGSLNVCDGNWHWIEIYGNWTNGSVTQQCYVDGIVQWNGVGNVSAAALPSMVALGGIATGLQTWDDFIVYDNTGSAPVNASFPVGPQQVNTIRPNGDSAVQFTPDTGTTNYTQINEVSGDTTHYVQDGTSGDQDLYNYDDLSFSPSRILGVMANSYLHNPGVGVINHNQICKNSSTTTTGTTTQTPITNPRVVQEPFVLDPNTGAAWASSTALNAAQFGIKVT